MAPMVLRSLTLNRRDAERVVEAIKEARQRKSGDEAAAWTMLLTHAIDTLDRIKAAETR